MTLAALDEPRRDPPLPARFRPVRPLGRGAFGEVWLADDVERGQRVALKLPHHATEAELGHLKRELRALAEVRHPGLVTIDELVVIDGAWALVMEPIEGVSLDVHLAGAANAGERAERIAALLPALGEALDALHAEGVLHLDLKPSNVRVTPDGRPVLLDFGLAGPLGALRRGVVGTPHYMAPEQVRGAELGPAADWYAVGVMVFEALCGRRPLDGRPAEVLARKVRQPAPPVRTLAPDAPPELAALTDALLERDPERRAASLEARRTRAQVRTSAPFVGRAAERARLLALLERTRERGEPSVLVLRGPSGRGKSALLRAFARDAAERGACVLRARCHPGDATPFAGLDPLVDALSGALARHRDLVERLEQEREAAALVRMFPSLATILRTGPSPLAPDDPEAQRGALRLLADALRNVAERAPVVALLDDAQWSDADGARALAQVIPSSGGALFVLAERADAEASPMRAALATSARVETLELAPLPPDDARSLARALAPDAAERLVESADGSPWLLEVLARRADVRDPDAALADELAELPPDASRALSLLALSGRPLPRALVAQATGDDGRSALRALEQRGLVRWATARRGSIAQDLEVVHDRVAVAARARLTDAAPLHAALDDAMERQGLDDPELRLPHALGAGRRARAASFARRAADQAREALAWERAAERYAQALELGEPDRAGLLARRAECLAAAGRSADAAEAYARASEASEGRQRRALARASAEQLLRGGYLEHGREAMARALEELGEPFRSTPRTLLSLVAHRRWLVVGPPPFVPRAAPDADAVERAAACLAAGVALTNVDSPRGAELVGRSLRLAARAGDLALYGRALAYTAAYAASSGLRAEAAIRRATDACDDIAERTGDAYVAATAEGARALSEFAIGRYARCVERCRAAKALYATCPGAVRERATSETYEIAGLVRMGRYAEAAPLRERFVRDALARDDRFVALVMETGVPLEVDLALDRADYAREALARARALLPDPATGYTVLHFFHGYGRVQLALHERDGAAAVREVESLAQGLERSLLRFMPFMRLSVLELEARAALAVGDRTTARRAAHALSRSGFPWAEAVGLALAGVAARRTAVLRDAIAAMSNLGLRGRELAVRVRLGEPALDALCALGVVDPTRYVDRLLPRS